MSRALALLLLALACGGCNARAGLPAIDSGIGPVTLADVQPRLLLPKSEIDVVGSGFVASDVAPAEVQLSGTVHDADGTDRSFAVSLPATFVSDRRLSASADALLSALGVTDGHLSLQATVVFASPIDRAAHASSPLSLELDVASTLTPRLDEVGGDAGHVNDPVLLSGDGFLLATAEGETHALVSGCFLPAGASGGCASAGTSVKDVDLTAGPAAEWDRTRVSFPFAPAIAGLGPGTFTGTVRVENRLASGQVVAASGAQPLSVTLAPPAVTQVSPTAASLGEYVDVTGAGFVGAAGDEVTLLHLTGRYTPTGSSQSSPVDLQLVPHFVDGHHLRYVLDEGDALGQVIDLRRSSGTFVGQVTPIARKGALQLDGAASPVTLAIAPLKQVVWVRFLPSYLDSLRRYGLFDADRAVRARVMAVAARDYAGVNIEFRETEPTDFALYSEVDVAGPDPNGLGLLGYDNTPGKDVGNQRLFDQIGGVNATTQADGSPGYGGIFAEEFLGFSAHPGAGVARLPVDPTHFDAIFDPVRPESGTPVTPGEAQAGIDTLPDGSGCPADPRDRRGVVACATFVLGNLIGTTLTHEVGHSLGLADPDGELFHDPGDQPNRLMEAGDDRPFEERAEIVGQGPGLFCDGEYTYLRLVLAGASTPPPEVTRPGCD